MPIMYHWVALAVPHRKASGTIWHSLGRPSEDQSMGVVPNIVKLAQKCTNILCTMCSLGLLAELLGL